jgi:glyoxylase-like metal-dependent hydrolase (beta-lactamase superfamily II)
MKTIEIFLDVAGHCLARESHSIRGGRRKRSRFYAIYALIHHPAHGWVLFDTGYARRFYDATRHFPNRLYRMATRVFVNEADEVKSRLGRFGLSPADIAHVVVSHFHADHIGGLKDFDRAVIHCSKNAFQQAIKTGRHTAFTRGILTSLIPGNLEQRVRFIEDEGILLTDKYFGTTYDLFGDGSLIIVPLPGHAAGQIGLRLHTREKAYFLVADACFYLESIRSMVMPGNTVRIISHSWKDYRSTLMKLHAFYVAHPEVTIVPSHCPETYSRVITQEP